MSMQAWMRIGQPLEPVMNDYDRIFDAWEAGGIRGFVFGRTLFADTRGQFTIPAFPANPQAYQNRGLEPNVRQIEPHPAKEKLLRDMLDNAKARGWLIFIFAPGSGASGAKSLPLEEDAYGAVGMRSSVRFHKLMGVSWMGGQNPPMNSDGIMEMLCSPIFLSLRKFKPLPEAMTQLGLNEVCSISVNVSAI